MKFEQLDAHLKHHLNQNPDIPGFDISIRQNHQTLFRAQYGYVDIERQIPVTGNELYCMYSCTKPITVTGAMRLVEEGKLSLDAPVSKYLPCFQDVYLLKDGQKITPNTAITVRHLFTMTAGFTYDMGTEPIRALLETGNERIPTTAFAQAVVSSPLAFEPGARYNYSLCHDLLGAVIEAAADMPFGEYQRKMIFDPLGMYNTGFLTTLSNTKQPAPVYLYSSAKKETRLHQKTHEFGLHSRYESGGAGLLSTVEDYAKFAAAMAHNGLSAEGYRILKQETIQMMKTEQLHGFAADPAFACAAGLGYGYGLGVRTLVSKDGGQRSPLGEFGWDGAAGSYVMIDTKHDLSIFFATHLRGWHDRFGALHAPIRDLTYMCLGIED